MNGDNMNPEDYNEKVQYCEYLFMGQPKEITLTFQQALNRYGSVVSALLKAGETVKLGSFAGIKDASGKWLRNYPDDYVL